MAGKSIYPSGKFNSSESSMGALSDELEGRGHRITLKWWELPEIPKPYLDNLDISRPAAHRMYEAIVEADVFILFPEDNILGAMGEFSFAVADKMTRNPTKEILVVDPFEVRQSIFYALSGVVCVRGLAGIRGRPWY